MPSITQRLGLPRYEADLRYKEALAAYLKKDLDAAITKMNEVLNLLPTHSEYWAARGLMYLEDGVNDAAKADFERAVKAFKLEMLGHYGLGAVAFREERYAEALTHLEEAQRLDPSRIETLYQMALTLDKLDRSAEALDLMTRAHDLMESATDKRKPDAVRWLTHLRRRVK